MRASPKKECNHYLGLYNDIEYAWHVTNGFETETYFTNEKKLKKSFDKYKFCPKCGTRVEMSFYIEQVEYCDMLKMYLFKVVITNRRLKK